MNVRTYLLWIESQCESCHTYEWESCHTYECESCHTHVCKSCHTYERANVPSMGREPMWVMSHIQTWVISHIRLQIMSHIWTCERTFCGRRASSSTTSMSFDDASCTSQINIYIYIYIYFFMNTDLLFNIQLFCYIIGLFWKSYGAPHDKIRGLFVSTQCTTSLLPSLLLHYRALLKIIWRLSR